MNEQNGVSTPASKRGPVWLALLGAGVLAAGGASLYQANQASGLRQQFAAAQHDNAALRAELSDTDASLRKSLDSMKAELDQAREETSASLQKTQGVATRRADLAASRIAKQQEERNKQLAEELDQVKASNLEASNKLNGITDDVTSVKSDVGSVRTDVASAKTDIQDTRSELMRARGDMGMMSGLIATNSTEIKRLREMGDRNIYEFTISKKGEMQKVGDIQIALRKADVKHNRYTLDLLADDKRVEKKDRGINEPVQFYTSKARVPYELVVNQVGKDKIVGYLATPKVMVSRNDQAER